MSYSRAALGMPAPFAPTALFAQAVDPYIARFSPPGAVYEPYGWGPNFNIGMPFNYTQHIGYERVPLRGTEGTGSSTSWAWAAAGAAVLALLFWDSRDGNRVSR